MTFDKAGW